MTLSINDAQELLNLYHQYCKLPEVQNAFVIGNLFNYDEVQKKGGARYLQKLHVTLSIEKIKQIFAEFHVILLREFPQSHKLLIGCGNSPIRDGYHKHKHDEYFTIDPDISMNPVIVGIFGKQSRLHKLLPWGHFESLTSEGMIIDKTEKDTFNCMVDGFTYFKMQRNHLIEQRPLCFLYIKHSDPENYKEFKKAMANWIANSDPKKDELDFSDLPPLES